MKKAPATPTAAKKTTTTTRATAPTAALGLNTSQLLEAGYDLVTTALGTMGYPVTTDPNFTDTSKRAAKAMSELVWPYARVQEESAKVLSVMFPLNGASGASVARTRTAKAGRKTVQIGDMVVCRNRVFFGLCPHHLLPVLGRISVAYIPSKQNVLGISKLPRLVDILSKQPMLQEAFVQEIADRLYNDVDSEGSTAVATAIHMCMACRGVRAYESDVVVAAIRGAFNKESTRNEFYNLLRMPTVNLS